MNKAFTFSGAASWERELRINFDTTKIVNLTTLTPSPDVLISIPLYRPKIQDLMSNFQRVFESFTAAMITSAADYRRLCLSSPILRRPPKWWRREDL